MRHRISAFVIFAVLAVAAVVVPVACSSDSKNDDAATDRVGSMTPG